MSENKMEAAREIEKAYEAFLDGFNHPTPREAFEYGYEASCSAHASRLAEAEAVIDHYAMKCDGCNGRPGYCRCWKFHNKAREYRRKYPADAAKGEEDT